MSDEMLHDDELDAVAGGTVVIRSTKVPTAYSTTEQKTKTTLPTPTNPAASSHAAQVAALSRFRPRTP